MTARPNRSYGLALKAFGTALLLAAFLAQNVMTESRDKRDVGISLLRDAANAELSLAKARLRSEIDAQTRQAAYAYLATVTMVCETYGCTSGQRLEFRDAARISSKIVDRATLNQFVEDYSPLVSAVASNTESQFQRIKERTFSLDAAFFSLYVVGSLCLVVGLIFEWRGAGE